MCCPVPVLVTTALRGLKGQWPCHAQRALFHNTEQMLLSWFLMAADFLTMEIVYQTWTYVTRGEHIALAGAFLLWLRCNLPVSQQIRQNKCSGFTNNVPCWWHYLWRRKRYGLSEERRHWGQVSCRSQFAHPFTLFRRWILIFLLWLPNYLPRVFLLISPHWQLGLQGMNERR